MSDAADIRQETSLEWELDMSVGRDEHAEPNWTVANGGEPESVVNGLRGQALVEYLHYGFLKVP